MNFGTPKLRRRKDEFHPNVPAMRMMPVGEQRTARKFVFNTKAAELLGLKKPAEGEGPLYVSVSFDNGIHIVNTTGVEGVEQYRVTANKPYSFSNKRLHVYFGKNVEGVDETQTNDFLLSADPNVGGDMNAFSISLLQAGDSYTEAVSVDTPAEEESNNGGEEEAPAEEASADESNDSQEGEPQAEAEPAAQSSGSGDW